MTQKQRVGYGIGGIVLVALIVLGIIWARGLGQRKPEANPTPSTTPALKVRGLSNDRFGARARVPATANVDIGVKTVRALSPTASPTAAAQKDVTRVAQLASPQVQLTNQPSYSPNQSPAPASTPAPAPDLPKFPPLAPAPQPQGREAVIVYAKGENGKRQIYLRSLERESDEQLVNSVYDNYGVSFSSSTQKVAFYSNEEGPSDQDRPRAKLKVVDLATGKTTTISGGLPGTWPVHWSPSGKKVAIPTTRSIFITDVTTGNSLQVPTGANPGGIVWSPTGLTFYYQAQGTGGVSDIFVADAIGAGSRPVTTTTVEEKAPSVSQDGSILSFFRAQSNSGFAVVTRGVNTGTERTIAQSTPSESYLWNLDLTKLLVTKGSGGTKLTELIGDQSHPIGNLPNPILVGWDRDYGHVFVLADDDQGKSLFPVDLQSGDAEKIKGDVASTTPVASR